jgi:hypothetical protein
MNEIFKSDRYFTLFDFLISHGQLLLRSQKSEELVSNIDIIFFDTTFVQTFSRLKGLRVSRVGKNSNNISYNTLKKYLSYDNAFLFEIDSNNEKYYIAASFVRVFENTLEFHETSLGYENMGREREVASSL